MNGTANESVIGVGIKLFQGFVGNLQTTSETVAPVVGIPPEIIFFGAVFLIIFMAKQKLTSWLIIIILMSFIYLIAKGVI